MKKTKSVIYWLFAAYVLLMLWLLFGQRMGVTSPGTYWDQISSRINLIPLQTITEFWNNLHGGGRSDSRNPGRAFSPGGLADGFRDPVQYERK